MGTLVLLLVFLSTNYASLNQPTVMLRQGALRGAYQKSRNGLSISAFLGIPYAEPPVGNLRFEPPVTAKKWSGTLNATHAPPDCLQYSHLTYHFPYCPVTGQEDCLYLNVFTPKLFNGKDSTKGLLDVIVFIHPGSWMYFGANYQGPDVLLDKDIILVTFNYRLGPLGFLSTGDSIVPGNNGLKDQVQALKWVQENIAAFGGDPGRVTLAGMSNGGASVHFHMLSPLSKGLFGRAISASGTALCPWSLAENVSEKAAKVASELGCPVSSSKEMVSCLKSRSAHHIAQLSTLFMPWLYNPYSPYGPVIEPENIPGAFISDSPLNIISKGHINDVPWLVTFTSEEGLYPAAEILGTESYIRDMDGDWEKLAPFVLDYNFTVANEELSNVGKAIRSHYKIDFSTDEGQANFVLLLSERLYLEGISSALRLHGKRNKSPIYVYQFSYNGRFSVADVLTKFKGKKRTGVCHGDDMAYLFPMPWFSNISPTESDADVSTFLRDIWVHFIQEGSLDWSSVQETYPEINYANIRGPRDINNILVHHLTSNREFWSQLPINEDKLNILKDEL